MNRMFFTGHVGGEPELTLCGANQDPRVQFSLAVTETFKKNGERVKKTTWVPVVAWGPITTNLMNIVKKGSLLLVEGKLRTYTYEKDGITRHGFEMRLERWELLKQPAGRAAEDSQASPDDDGPDSSEEGDDEIPF